MTIVETTGKEAVRLEAMAAHVQALITGLAPNPQEWEYRGEMEEDDSGNAKCVCGHQIRYLFPVYRGNAQRILGSTCIEHYSLYRPEDAQLMREALQRVQERAKEAARAARKAAADNQATTARDRHEALYRPIYDRFMGYRNRGEMAPRPLWEAIASPWRISSPGCCPKYARPSDVRKWHEKQSAALERYMNGNRG